MLRVVQQPLRGHGRKRFLWIRDALPLEGVVMPSVLKFLADAPAHQQAAHVRIHRDVALIVQAVQVTAQQPVADLMGAAAGMRLDVRRFPASSGS